MKKNNNKLAQRDVYVNGYHVTVGLVNNIGYISLRDGNLYSEGDSRDDRHNLGFDTMMIPLMTREDLKSLRIAIDEVLKNSK
jgi:hypothetical protein